MTLINDRFELKVENHIAHVSMTRPEKMNAIDEKTFEAIPQVNDALRADKSIRCVILSGQGGNFCAGLDKSNFASLFADPKDTDSGAGESKDSVITGLEARTHGIANTPQYAAWMWRELPMPVISAIEGVALGGGLQIALGADFRIASKDSQFSILELKWGIIPDMSSTQIMRHMIRDDIIRELTYTARLFSAEEAKEWGFVTHVSDDPVAHAQGLAEKIVQKNPHAIRGAKKVIDQSYYQSAQEGLLTESVEQDKVIGKKNQIEAVMSVFQKRTARYED